MIHLLGIKSNTDFPKKIELHNNHKENCRKITQQKVLSKQTNANAEILKPKKGQVN